MEKMVYERPVMKAELFQANEYVAACHIAENSFLRIFWNKVAGPMYDIVNNQLLYYGNWGSTWVSNMLEGGIWGNGKGYDTDHSFEGSNQAVEGGAGGYYWTTTNDDKSQGLTGTYYLQYSNLQDALGMKYQLFYESNGTEGLQNVHDSNDTQVAWVTVTQEENRVVSGS